MFDKYLIVEGSLQNVSEGGRPIGFSFGAKLGYYRGLGLTMLEDLAVTIDGDPAPREAVRFEHEDGPLSLEDMETAGDRRWEFGEIARIMVYRPGGLQAGEHKISLTEQMRISYLPFPLKASDEKILQLV